MGTKLSALQFRNSRLASHRRGGPPRPLLETFAAFAIWMLTCSFSSSGADEVLQATCDQIKYEVGNCSCAVEFLRQNIGTENALVLMQNWAISANKKGDFQKEFAALYREHSQQEMLQAAVLFLNVRIQFYTLCQPAISDLWDLD
jgi:hypothetical protein